MVPVSIKALLVLPSISISVSFAVPNIQTHGLELQYSSPLYTPACLNCLLKLIPPWSSMGEDWRVMFPPPISHLNFDQYFGSDFDLLA